MKSPRRITLALAVALVLVPASQLAAQSDGGALDTEDKRMLYAIGLAVAQQLATLNFSEDELAIVQQGIADQALGREPKVDLMTYGPKLQTFAQARVQQGAAAEKGKSAEYVAKMAAEEGAVTTDSGLVIRELTAGTGASPAATDTVTVHYHGTLRDGTVFDSSVDRGEPTSFPLNGVISCWTEGLQLMKVGGKSKLTCPADIAYGDGGRPGIPGGAALTFEVELISIKGSE